MLRNAQGGSGLLNEKTCDVPLSLPVKSHSSNKASCSCLNNPENQCVKHSNEKSYKRRADSTPKRLGGGGVWRAS